MHAEMPTVTLATLAALFFGGLVALVVIGAGRLRRARAATLTPAPRPGEVFTLGGRRFRRIERASLLLDEHVHQILLDAGISEPELRPGERPDEYLDRIYAAMHKAKADRPLVAAILRPAGVPEPADEEDLRRLCEETTRFLGTLDGERDKATFLAIVAEILRPFSLRGLPSWLRSRSSTNAPLASVATSAPRTPSFPAGAAATGRG